MARQGPVNIARPAGPETAAQGVPTHGSLPMLTPWHCWRGDRDRTGTEGTLEWGHWAELWLGSRTPSPHSSRPQGWKLPDLDKHHQNLGKKEPPAPCTPPPSSWDPRHRLVDAELCLQERGWSPGLRRSLSLSSILYGVASLIALQSPFNVLRDMKCCLISTFRRIAHILVSLP